MTIGKGYVSFEGGVPDSFTRDEIEGWIKDEMARGKAASPEWGATFIFGWTCALCAIMARMDGAVRKRDEANDTRHA